jgi:hypothetical protein
MSEHKKHKSESVKFKINTNEVMHDYEFYLKMHRGDYIMDFEAQDSDF